MEKINPRIALMQLSLMLQAIVLEGNEEDIKCAFKTVCHLDDDLINRYWKSTQELVVSSMAYDGNME